MRVSRILAFVGVIGVVGLGVVAMVGAHGGNDDPSVIHACVGNNSKIVRIVGVNGTCVTSPGAVAETPIHWSIQGQAGAPGANGTNGTNGTNGANGTSVTFVGYFGGNQNGCPNGGAIFAVGGANTYVCNGQNGATPARPDGPCFDNLNRYVNCGNGTVTDTVTGLIWLARADCLGSGTWAAMNQGAAGLKNGDCNLSDKSSAGDWRLATEDEWRKTIAEAIGRNCRFGGTPPSLTNDLGMACYGNGSGSSFTGVAAEMYWTSSAKDLQVNPGYAWVVDLSSGLLFPDSSKVFPRRGWAVRSR